MYEGYTNSLTFIQLKLFLATSILSVETTRSEDYSDSTAGVISVISRFCPKFLYTHTPKEVYRMRQ